MQSLPNYSNLSKADKVAAIEILERKEELKKERRCVTAYESLYGWQNDFVASTKDYFESCLCAANQIGKTYTGTTIDAMHLLGDYPDDWVGHRFEFAPLC